MLGHQRVGTLNVPRFIARHGTLLRCLKQHKSAAIAVRYQYDNRDGSIQISDRFQSDS